MKRRWMAWMLVAGWTTGCNGTKQSDPGSESQTGGTAVASDDSGEGTDGADPGSGSAMHYDCVEPELQVGVPLAGPGYDPETGLIDPQDEYVAHTTQLLVAPEGMAMFEEDIERILAQLMVTPGLVAVSFASEPTCGFVRTLGIWRSQEAMVAFVTSGAHADAMSNGMSYTITGRTTHWTVSSEEVPVPWEVAVERISDVPPLAGYGSAD